MVGRRWVGRVLGAVLLCACAGKQPEEQHYDWAGEYVYAQSAERLFPEVKAFFAKRRVGLKSARGRAGYYLVSEWQESFQGSRISGNFWRYYVEVSPLGPESASVHVFRHTMFTGGKEAVRRGSREEAFTVGIHADVDEQNVNSRFNEVKSSRLTRFNRDRKLEWALLRQLAPRAAAAEEARARR
jgi:hypothetical protein